MSEQAWIEQNTPNPFTGITLYNFFIPESNQEAAIHFFDMNGKFIKATAITEKGKGTLKLNVDNLPVGTYVYQLVVDNVIVASK